MTLEEAKQHYTKTEEDAREELRLAYIDTLKRLGMHNVDVVNTTGKKGRILVAEDFYTYLPKYEFHAYMQKGRLSKKTTGLIYDENEEEQLRNKFKIVGDIDADDKEEG